MSAPLRSAAAALFAAWVGLAAAPARAAQGDKPDVVDVQHPGFVPPKVLQKVEPDYPEAARAEGLTADVLVQIVIGADGGVQDARIPAPAGHGFDEAALAAVRKMRFSPATHDGQAIPVQVNYELHFRLATQPALKLSDTVSAQEIAPLEATVESDKPFTAASSRVVRDRDFLLRPRVTPEDILRAVPGLVIAQHQGGGKADQLFLRGFDADHGTDVAVSLDGIPVNMPSHAHGQGYADLHFLIPEAVERLEVTKGPYFAELGDFDTAGAINLVTRKSFEGSQLTLAGGTHSTYRLLGIANADAGKLHSWFAAEVYGTQGPFLHGEGLQRYNLFAKSTYDLSANASLSALFLAYGSGWTGSGQIPARLVDEGFLDRYGSIDPTEGGDTQRQQLILSLRARPDKDSSFNLSASAIRYGLTLFNDFTFQLNDPIHGDEIEQDDRRVSLFAQARYERTLRELLPGQLIATLGAQVRSDDIDASLWKVQQRARLTSCGAAANPCVDTNTRQTDAAAYLQLDYRPIELVRVILGLRSDELEFDVRPNQGLSLSPGDSNAHPPSVQRNVVSPKASAVVAPIRELELFLNFGRGFHSNDARSVVQGGGSGATPHATAAEFGARGRLFGDTVDLAFALWRLDLASELVWNGDEGGTTPAGATRRYGVDLEARWQILPWLSADVDASFAKAQYKVDGGNGNAVALAPPRIVTGGLTARHPSGFNASLRVRHIGSRPATQLTQDDGVPMCTPALDAGTPAGQRCYLVADGYTVLDATIGFQAKRWGVSLLLENLTNTAYREAQFGNVSQVVAPPDGNIVSRTTGALWVPEAHPITDLHYTPGNPFGGILSASLYF